MEFFATMAAHARSRTWQQADLADRVRENDGYAMWMEMGIQHIERHWPKEVEERGEEFYRLMMARLREIDPSAP